MDMLLELLVLIAVFILPVGISLLLFGRKPA